MISTPAFRSFCSSLPKGFDVSMSHITWQELLELESRLEIARLDFEKHVSKQLYKLKAENQIQAFEQLLIEFEGLKEVYCYDISDELDKQNEHYTLIVYFEDLHNDLVPVPNDVLSEEQSYAMKLVVYSRYYRRCKDGVFEKYYDLVGRERALSYRSSIKRRERLGVYWQYPFEEEEVLPIAPISASEALEDTSTLTLAPLQWKGSGVELAALFVELEAKGYIELPGHTNYSRFTWEQVCQAIEGLFTLTTRRKTSKKGGAWETLATYFKTKTVNKKTGEVTYGKLEGVRHKFEGIMPSKPAPND